MFLPFQYFNLDMHSIKSSLTTYLSHYVLQSASLERRPTCVTSDSSNFMANLTLRSRFLGEVSHVLFDLKMPRTYW